MTPKVCRTQAEIDANEHATEQFFQGAAWLDLANSALPLSEPSPAA